jgi:hypothetical protein
MAADIRLTSEVDANGVKKGFAKIQNISRAAGEHVGRQFSKSFNKQINKFLGVGAVLALGRSFSVLAKQAEKVNLQAILTGMSPEQVKAMEQLAEDIGSAFTSLPVEEQKAFADQLIASGESAGLTAEQMEKLTGASNALQSAGNKLQLFLSNIVLGFAEWGSAIAGAAKSVTNLLKSTSSFQSVAGVIKSISSQAESMWKGLVPEKVRKFLAGAASFTPAAHFLGKGAGTGSLSGGQTETERITREIAGRPPDAPQTASRRSSPASAPQIQSDQLQRIGLFVGGAGNPAIAIAKEQVVELKRLNQQMREQTREFREAFR